MRKLLTILLIAPAIFTHAQIGALDPTFTPTSGANNKVLRIIPQSSGKIIITGTFTAVNGYTRRYITCLNSDGSVGSFGASSTGQNNAVSSFAVQPDGKVLIGGLFTTYANSTINRIARLNMNGIRDTGFNPGSGANHHVQALAVQPNGKIIVAGYFTSYNGVSRVRVARVNSNGSLDTSFDPGLGANNQVKAVALQPDGKIIIGGDFTSYDGTSTSKIARLNTDGSLDNSFNPGTGANNAVYSIIVLPTGKILIGGDFTTYDGNAINYVARLNANGSLDNTYNLGGSGPDAPIRDMLRDPDGKTYIAGAHTNYNGTFVGRIARINDDGSLDAAIGQGTGFSGTVFCLALQTDGKLLAGGSFTSYNGTSMVRIARLLTEETIWTGSGGSNWNTPSSWSSNSVPAASDNVTIPNVANDPVISSLATINDITLEAGATITVNAGGTFTLNGTLDNSGTVTIQNGGAFLQGNSSSLSGSGNFTIQRTGSSGSAVNFWSSPINGQGSVPGSTSYSYNSALSTQDTGDDQPLDPGWTAYNGPMTPGVGYAGVGAGTVSFSGVPNNGNINRPLAYYAYNPTNTSPGTPFNLVGNPYPSAISCASLVSANPDIDGSLYFWDDDLSGGSGYSSSDFAVWNGTGSLGTGAGTVGAPNGFISTAQGFLVRALNGSSVLNFTNTQRLASNNTQFFKANGNDSRIWLSIEGDDVFNQVLIGVLEDATEDEDRLYDAVKMKGNQNVSLSAIANDIEHAILAFPPPSVEKTIPLSLSLGEGGTYRFHANTMEGFEGTQVHFIDSWTAETVLLQEGTQVEVMLSGGDYEDRFYLQFSPSSPSGIDDNGYPALNAFVVNESLQLTTTTSLDVASVRLYNTQGQLVFDMGNMVFSNGRASIPLNGIATGVYVVQVTGDDINIAERIIKN